MTKLEQAARQALEALREYRDTQMIQAPRKAIDALREALAEPQITTPDVCGEVCARAKLCYGCNKDLEEANAKYVEQAEQRSDSERMEPVARVTGYYGGRCVIEPLNRATVLPTDMALYAAPVQQVTRADLKAAFKEGFERAADLYAPKDGQEPYAYEVWDVQDQSFTMIYATQLKEFHWIEPENIARVLYDAPVQQAEQEPVAWANGSNLSSAVINRQRSGQGDTHTWSETKTDYHSTPLYAAPVQQAEREPVALLQLAADALVYHTEQTRPIQNTIDVLAAIQKFKEKQR